MIDTNRKWSLPLLLLALLALGTGCDRNDAKKKGPPATVVTVTKVTVQNLEITQESIGQVESDNAPTIAAEVAGKVAALHVEVGQRVARGQVLAELDPQDQHISRQAAAAEVNRVQALLENQQRLVERYQKLVQENFVSRAMLETNESQLAALREQLAVAKAQLDNADRSVGKTRVVSPVAGRIEQRMIAAGDYVSVGKPLFQVATAQALRAHLPFPETVASQLRPGLTVRLTTPTANKTVIGRIADLRPMIDSENRAIDAIVDVPNPGDWRPGASVQGVVVLGERKGALVVPEQSVVQRPAGEVIYVVRDGKTEQRVVKVGLRQNGNAEILAGVSADETVVVDGAAFLTDKTAITVRQPAAPAQAAAPLSAPGSAPAPAPTAAK